MSATSFRRWWPVAVGLFVAAVVSVGGASAWACVPQPRLVAVLPMSSGPPGAEVTIDGLGFDPGRAEVRWNSREGELLATADGPDFSVAVTVPDVPPGLYAMVVLSRRPGGAIGNTARAAFEVTGGNGGHEAPAPATSAPATVAATAPSSSSSSSDAWPTVGVAAGGAVVAVTAAAAWRRSRRRRPVDRW